MAFTVYIPSESSPAHAYGDNDVYKMPSSGKLIVEPASGTQILTYNNWTYIDADADHPAGRIKGSKGGGAFVGA